MRRALITVVVLVALLTSAGASLAAAVHRAVLRPAVGGDGLVVVLAIGSDAGPPHRSGDLRRGRADAVHLLAADPATRRATLVDIPRDAVVGGSKVNAHLAFGGPERLVAQLESFTGVDIDYWAVTSFFGLERLVDELGGVDIVVDLPMQDPFSGSNLQPGPQRLNGPAALAFTRDRKSMPDGDFGRSRHQGDLLLAAQAQVRSQNDLASLTRLVGVFARNTVSNIPAPQLLALAQLAVDIDPASIAHVPLSGGFTRINGESAVNLAVGDTFARIAAGEVGPPPPAPPG